MSGEDEAGLFVELPEQEAPARPSGGRPRLRRPERGQVELRAVSLDDLVPAGHRVRLVWAFAEELDLSCLYAQIRSVEGHPGHPPADPRVLLALWLYATIEGVGSARELARLCREHIAFQWLCGGVSVNHKTLSDFRVGQGALLERLLVTGFAALLKAGVARLERVAQDGMRVRASAGAASFRRLSTLKQCRQAATERLRQLRSELEDDPGAAGRRQAAAQRRAAKDRQARVAAALEAAEKLEGSRAARAKRDGRRSKGRTGGGKTGGGKTGGGDSRSGAAAAGEAETKEPRASTTDPEARVMKMADGGYRPAYNVQFATDPQSGLIAGMSVDNIGSDMGKLRPMSEQLERHYGRRPAEHLVDGGFAKLDDVEALHNAGVTVYAPVPMPRDRSRDRYAPLSDDPPGVAAWRQRMNREDARAIYRERAASAECTNAHARNRGLLRFMVRGTDKVRAVVLWHALAHNMACSWRLAPA